MLETIRAVKSKYFKKGIMKKVVMYEKLGR